MQGALGDAADGRVEARHVAPAGEDADAPLLALVHDCLLHTQVSPSTRMKAGSPRTSGSVFILSRAAKNWASRTGCSSSTSSASPPPPSCTIEAMLTPWSPNSAAILAS